MPVAENSLGLLMLSLDILASCIKLSVNCPYKRKPIGSSVPLIMAISDPTTISTMSRPSANLNYICKKCAKTKKQKSGNII